MLSGGAGKIVPIGDVEAFSEAICDFFDSPDELDRARTEARRVGAALAWPSVARHTIAVLREAAVAAPRDVSIAPLDAVPRDVRFDHLHVLVDDVGIIQHASGSIPNRSTGYCVDDVARLVVVATELGRREPDRVWGTMVNRGISFLADATGDGSGGMRNFMGYDRRWLDEPHHGDHVGRSVWALGEVLGTAWTPALVTPTADVLGRIIDGFEPRPSLRTAAYAILGLARLDGDRIGIMGRHLLARLVAQLAGAYDESAAEGWRWFEDRLTYDNARLPQALIVGGAALGNQADVDRGLESLRWLGDECGLADGLLRLIGHEGRDRGAPGPGGGDEQPLDACAFVEAELAAYASTGDPEHGARAHIAFDWFLGRNSLGAPLYDFATGGCCDGLAADHTSINQGAESTLAFHRAHLALDQAGLPSVSRRAALQPAAVA